MSEISKKQKVAKIMPGYDYSSGDLKAYDLQNTIILGRCGSGIESIVNNIIMNLVQNFSPKEVSIQYFSYIEDSPWLNENRQIPHFRNQVYGYSKPDANAGVKKCLLDCIRAYNRGIEEDFANVERHNVIMLEVTPSMLTDSDIVNAIKTLARITADDCAVHFILVSRGWNSVLDDIVDCFGLRLITRIDEDISNMFLGCNLASREEEKYGFVWVTETKDFYNKKRLNVPYKPDSFYGKACKYLSNNSFKEFYDSYQYNWEFTTGFEDYRGLLLSDTLCACMRYYQKSDGFDYLRTLTDEEVAAEYLKCTEELSKRDADIISEIK